jgi:hypothetical protein
MFDCFVYCRGDSAQGEVAISRCVKLPGLPQRGHRLYFSETDKLDCSVPDPFTLEVREVGFHVSPGRTLPTIGCVLPDRAPLTPERITRAQRFGFHPSECGKPPGNGWADW